MTTTKQKSENILDFPIKDLGGAKLETRNISIKEIANAPTYQGGLRALISQEMELDQLTQLEERYEMEFDKTRSLIRGLDEISPDRPSNPCFLSWKGYYNSAVRTPYGLFEELTHIASQYTPDLCKYFFCEVKGQKLSTQRFRKSTKKERTNLKGDLGSVAMWKEIISKIGSQYYTKPLRPDFYDYFLCVGELANFYYGLVEEDYGKTGSFAFAEETRNREMVAIILSIYDIFWVVDFDLDNDPVSGGICPKLTDFDLSVITKHKNGLMKIAGVKPEKEVA